MDCFNVIICFSSLIYLIKKQFRNSAICISGTSGDFRCMYLIMLPLLFADEQCIRARRWV